jgi:hypothetical protein
LTGTKDVEGEAMNETERLMRLLDERGADYDVTHIEASDWPKDVVWWRGIGGMEFHAFCTHRDPDMLYVNGTRLKAEEVVAITLPVRDGRRKAELKAENEMLRRLVIGLNWCTESADGPRADCKHCPLGEVEGKPLELTCENMMAELGIEVWA